MWPRHNRRLVAKTQPFGYLLPIVLAADGFQVRIYFPPREYDPPHVHVRKSSAEVVISLEVIPGVSKVRGMPARDVVQVYRIVERHRAMLLAYWRLYHG